MRIAVLQLSRLGDILMSLPTIDALSRKYAGCDIFFFVDGLFKDLLPCSPRFTLVPIEFDKVVDELQPVITIDDCLRVADKTFGEFLELPFDLVVNLSGGTTAAAITALFKSKDTRGLTYSADGSLIHSDPDLALFTQHPAARSINWAHQVEIFRSVSKGLSISAIHESANNLFGDAFTSFIGERFILGKYVLVAPEASLTQKEIPMPGLATIIDGIITRTSYGVVLCGNRMDELVLSGDYSPERFLDVRGYTDFRGLWNLIQFCECLVSSDSGPMHMAATLGKKSVVLSIGPSFFPETAGYNDDVVVVTPVAVTSSDGQAHCYPCPWIGCDCSTGFSCSTRICWQDVVECVRSCLEDGGNCLDKLSSRTYRTFIGAYGIEFRPYREQPLDVELCLGLIYQALYKGWFFNANPSVILAGLLDHWPTTELVKSDELFDGPAQALGAAISFVDRLLKHFDEAGKGTEPCRSKDIATDVDRIFKAAGQNDFVAPLFQYFKVLYHSVSDADQNVVLMRYHEHTKALRAGLDQLSELLSFCQNHILPQLRYCKRQLSRVPLWQVKI